ncbi:fumarylacetoacetate hydrolase family protein [Wenzhouxiangella limi]|uniref:Fumarylacetoacetate hydrolase family protein n=1 Tax=Wenzhouxiangella limi TaxID=2707351 RepID=A0A845UXW1_9GAMM|nr:fumarylacetoacetate hydrolase family protein [Wenzhouxiangella limi]NDY96693.1 fumarylacetoacetate hydrolase family protein [Wenzhouxiangella limi]
MKLATLKQGGRDGTLIVVSRELTHAVRADGIAPTLQAALDQWDHLAPRLNALYDELNAGTVEDIFDLDLASLAAPLPRCYQFVDGSAYLPHVERVRRARGAEVPESFQTDPLMYQAVSDGLLGPCDDIAMASTDFGIDFESEIGVITDDIPMGASAAECADHIQLLTLINDVSLRKLIPGELAKGFGFLQSKPRSALAPVVVTPDELGQDWRGAKLHRPLKTWLNGELFGEPEAGEDMQFSFAELLAHAAHTRPLAAGTLLGSGTIANQDTARGASCLAEKRMLEIIAHGKPSTPFLQFGDVVRIEMFNRQQASIFGAIEQTVIEYRR